MAMLLYDLTNRTGKPCSPYGWRVREAFRLLGIQYEAELLTGTEVAARFAATHKTVPVIDDNGHEVGDSWKIAVYLSENYDPDNKLLAGDCGPAMVRFITHWVDASIMGALNRIIIKDYHDKSEPEIQRILRATAEKRYGQTLEQLQETREEVLPAFQISLYPARELIKLRDYLAGSRPAYCDFALHAAFQWARTVSDFKLLRDDDRLHGWIDRMDQWLTA